MMPSKNSPSFKRPPSPYSYSVSPRTSNSKRVWRPLNGTGQAHVDTPVADSAREKWLRSLRQGFDPKRSLPGKGHHSSLNASHSSNYLREQISHGRSTPQARRNSIGETASTTRYKSQEDMYDEIIALKKTIVKQNEDYDVMKAKGRRLEEENIRKDKYIQQLLHPGKNDEKIRQLVEGNSASGSTVVAGLKQRQMKLEKQLRDKENELNALKNDVKKTDIEEMRQAMEIYYQEVLRLRDIASAHESRSESLNSSLMSERGSVPPKIKSLRKKVVELTSHNNNLLEENRGLKRDLERLLDGDNDFSNATEGEIKYSALDKVELITLIKENKESEKRSAIKSQEEFARKEEKWQNRIEKLKSERSELHQENEELHAENKRLLRDVEEEIKKNREVLKRLDREEFERAEGRRKDFQRKRAAKSIQRQWRKHKANKMNKMKQQQEMEEAEERDEDDLVLLQSAFRGHLSRQNFSQDQSENRHPQEAEVSRRISSSDELSDDNVVLLQSAMRGHLERKHQVAAPRSRSQSIISSSSHIPSSTVEESEDSDDDVVMGTF